MKMSILFNFALIIIVLSFVACSTPTKVTTVAKVSNKVIIVATAPDGSHTPVIYSVAVIKSSEKASAAKEFLKFVYSDKARTIFAEEGFENYELFIEL